MLAALRAAASRSRLHAKLALRVAANLALLCASGCSGLYLSPGVTMPALERAGQVRTSASITALSPASGAHANLAVAATDTIRVGGALSAAFDRDTRRGLFGELFAGAEPRVNHFLQYGLLASAGYGQVTDYMAACERGGHGEGVCLKPAGYVDHASARYWRYAAQAYVVLRAPRVVHGGAGLRTSLLAMEFNTSEQPNTRGGLPITLEPFFMVRAGWKRLQFGPELRYVAVFNDPREAGKKVVLPDRFVIAIGVAVLLGPVGEERTRVVGE
jgi:hypothetical protein